MKPLKLVVSGPVEAGKTTFIQSLVETDEWASVVLDGAPTHLFGTSGQERFDFVWDVLVEGALGLVVLVGGDQPAHFPKARHILEYLTSRHPVPFVLGVTRQDLPRVWAPEDVADYFGLPHEQVVGLNATSPTSATLALIRMLELVTGERWQGIY